MSRSRVWFNAAGELVSVEGDGTPYVATEGLRLRRRKANDFELVVSSDTYETKSPDILVGDVPVLFVSRQKESISTLRLNPPKPFSRNLVEQMQGDIYDQLVKISGHNSIGHDRSLGLPSGSTLSPINVDFLAQVARISSDMLSSWPTKHSTDILWRQTELPGGREDFKRTVREPRQSRFYALGTDATYPERTARIVSSNVLWTSTLLARAAANLYKQMDLENLEPGRRAGDPFSRLLLAVAERAAPESREPSTPLSTWPAIALQLYIAIRRAHSSLAETSSDSPNYLPSTLLWRLYEHWVGALLLPPGGRVYPFAANQGSRYEWSASWEENGAVNVLLAQPEITGTFHSFDGALMEPVRSITSRLIPDYLLQSRASGRVITTAIDCKRRLPGGLKARDIAESGSKYCWGIRVGRDEMGSQIDQAYVLTSSESPPAMNDRNSLISALSAIPTSTAPEWRDRILQHERLGSA